MSACRSLITAALLLLLPLAGQAAEGKRAVDASKLPPPSSKANVTFDNDVKPLFERSCLDCHGEKRPKAGLHLISREEILKSGKGYVVPGDSAKSILVHDVSSIDDRPPRMPARKKAGGYPLSRDEVGLVRAWIDQGAK